MQTCDGRGDQRAGREAAGGEADVLEPGLVELDFLDGVAVGRVVELVVSEGMGQVHEAVTVGGDAEPDGEGIEVHAGAGPPEGCGSSGPYIAASSERLLELEGSVRRRVVPDWLLSADAGAIGTRFVSVLNVAIAVVTNLREIEGACVHLGLNGRNPSGDVTHVVGNNTILLACRAVETC